MHIRVSTFATIAIVFSLVSCAGPAVQSNSVSGTTAMGSQATNVAMDVARWHNAHHPNCTYVRTVAVKVIERLHRGVVEHWTIAACGDDEFTYRAYLIPSPSGALTVMVSDVGSLD